MLQKFDYILEEICQYMWWGTVNEIRNFSSNKSILVVFFLSFLFVSRNQWCTMNVEYKNVSVSSHRTQTEPHTTLFYVNQRTLEYTIQYFSSFASLLAQRRNTQRRAHMHTCLWSSINLIFILYFYHISWKVCAAHQQTLSQTKMCFICTVTAKYRVFVFHSKW